MIPPLLARRLFAVLMLALPAVAAAQGTPPPVATAAPSPLQDFAWLAGCWEGKVNQRDFREEWLPLRGDIMVGASQTALLGKTQSFEFLRIESRADGLYYIPMPSGKKETLFRMASRKTDGEDVIFTFENPSGEFPQRIIYRHGSGGWLYAHVGGMVNGEAKEVIYPFRHVDCQSGDFILK
jgi:Domain of unknown function (DUF6265)